MRKIKERFFYCFGGVCLCSVAAVWFAVAGIGSAAALFAVTAAVLFCFTMRVWRGYQAAKLICDNPILKVNTASVAEISGDGKTESCADVVVSGFGILMEGKPYQFGHDDIRLTNTAIDGESITLSFGGNRKDYSVRLLHGIADSKEIQTLSARLRYETGVEAKISGW